MKIKNIALNFLLLSFSVFICLAVCEFGYRKILFGSNPKWSGLRKPQHYASYNYDSDYWKLYYLLGGEFKPPANPHPLLGWVGDFDRKTLKHNKTDSLKGKRPVLLYGDSYAQCVGDVQCFQSILNADTAFTKNNYLLNYGVGGYATDQISILCKNTYKLYDKPFVVFSLMTEDLDRSMLTNRIGQKPYFELSGDSLALKGVPIDSNPQEFFKKNPPQIVSYLWRKIIYADSGVLPESVKTYLRGAEKKRQENIKLNTLILKDVIDELRKNKIDFVFLVFHYLDLDDPEYNIENDNDWHNQFLKDFMVRNKVPFIWSKDLIRNDRFFNPDSIERYIPLATGHPSTYLNEMVSKEIEKRVLQSEE